jgi:hypothetical protein
MLRDPRYLLPLAVLAGVILVSAAFARQGHVSSAAGTVAGAATAAAARTSASAPEATPDDASVDHRRAGDLAAIQEALDAYRQRTGGYPDTKKALTTLCAYPGDAGCALSSIAPDLPFSDGEVAYRYESDGSSYHLIAPARAQGDTSQCPRLPQELASASLICVRGGGR